MAIESIVLRARRVTPSLVIQGTDILAGLSTEAILSFKYTDSTSDKADDLSISLADPQRTWMKQYGPKTKKGTECQASMTIESWTNPMDTRKFECGIFFIGEVHFKGPPNAIEIKATSIPPNGVKSEKKFKSWENQNLKNIAGEIAQKNNLTLFYDTQENPIAKRTDQTDKSDLEYLRDRCKEAKLSMKIHKKQLVVYSEEEYEARPPAFMLKYGATNILDWDFVSKNDDTFEGCSCTYLDPDTGLLVEGEFKPSRCPDGTTSKLRINEAIENEPDDPDPDPEEFALVIQPRELYNVNNWSDTPGAAGKKKGKGKGSKKNATRKAKAKLREKNKKEKKSKIKVFGNIDYLSGLTCQFQDWGESWDIKWFIESSTHSVEEGGYTTELHLRGALEGY